MDLSKILDLIFPHICVNCRRSVERGEVLCARCFATIELNRTLFCGRCQARLPDGQRICHFSFPYLLGAAGNYHNEALRRLIYTLKFEYLELSAAPLGGFAVSYLERLHLPLEDFVVIPVPLARERLRERGFNQAERIAEVVSSRLRLPFYNAILERRKNTAPQTTMADHEARLKNVAGCFTVADPNLIRRKNVILIDDVTTSGATFLEATQTMKQSGARRVVALAVAKG